MNNLAHKTIDIPVNMPLFASTGPVLVRCWQHRPNTGPVLAHNGMFMGCYWSVIKTKWYEENTTSNHYHSMLFSCYEGRQ